MSSAVATVLGNWHNVLRAINMASSTSVLRAIHRAWANHGIVKIPQPKETEEVEGETPQNKTEFEKPLPQTLVRIPTEHAPMLQQSSTGGGDNED